MKKILNDLVEYAVDHFRHEEKLMKRPNYPDLENHLAAHQTLVEQVGKFTDEFQPGRATLSSELFKFLRSWLNGHIRGTDKSYSPQLQGGGGRLGAGGTSEKSFTAPLFYCPGGSGYAKLKCTGGIESE